MGRCVSLGCCFVGFVLLLPSHGVRHEVCADVRLITFTVAILAQGTNRGDALCAALLLNRVGTILARHQCFTHRFFFFFLSENQEKVFKTPRLETTH